MKSLLVLLLTFSLPLFLHAQEICDNGIDDDADGLIDLNDPDCQCSGLLSVVNSRIPNSSFEDRTCCPTSFSQMGCAVTWRQASDATSDYFSFCGNFTQVGTFPVPPLPPDGESYAGFYSYTGYKEMVGACLTEPIEAGVSYRFSLFVAAPPRAAPLALSIYGATDCNDLPWPGYECPVGNGSWVLLGTETVTFSDSSWIQVTIPITTAQDIHALAIGGPCGPVSGSVFYYYVDQLIVARSAEFDLNAHISETGKWCTNDLKLRAAIDTTGGFWQWYRAGIALPGETADSLDLMVYGTEEDYTSVYTLGGDCVSVEYSVDVEVFQDIIPELIISPSCTGFSNGKAYVAVQPEDTASFLYQWRAGNDTTILSEADSLMHVPPGDYSVQITITAGCDTTLYFEISEVNFQVSFSPSDTIVCVGEPLVLNNTSDAHFAAYYWVLDNGDTFSGMNPPPYAYAESGNYHILLAGAGEVCSDTTYQTVVVDAPIVPDFDFSPKEICVGQIVVLVPHTDSTTTRVQWEVAEDKRVEESLQGRYQFAFTKAGDFPIKLEMHSRACRDTSYTDSITVYSFPEVDLGGDSSICLHGQPIYLKNLRTTPTGLYHQVWNTGDTAAVLKVVHPGVYTLSVTAGPIGCTTTESIEITKECYIDIPNVFTPNGDGYNDYFLPRQLLSESVRHFQMQVFNRWGQLLFETNRPDGRGWDGLVNGKAQPQGVYPYRIAVGFTNGGREQYEGNVTLLR